MLPACMSGAANRASGEALNRMCVSVQNPRLAMRMITSTKEATEVGVLSESVR